jgi:hypothetical protein
MPHSQIVIATDQRIFADDPKSRLHRSRPL